MSLLFGTSGIPASTAVNESSKMPNESTLSGIRRVAELGLGCMELAFVHGVYIKEADAPAVRKTAEENHVRLSCHAPYYINLNAKEDQKVVMSQKYILSSAKIANLCGADTVVFHAGYYLEQDPRDVYLKISEQIKIIQDKLDEENNPITIRPEVSGKISQFGTFDELTSLALEDPRINICIDFAHWHARYGKFNSYEEFDKLLKDLHDRLGDKGTKNVHFHMSGINYGPKGELNHLPLRESDFMYEEVIQAWADNKLEGKIICESPIREEDALLLQSIYNSSMH